MSGMLIFTRRIQLTQMFSAFHFEAVNTRDVRLLTFVVKLIDKRSAHKMYKLVSIQASWKAKEPGQLLNTAPQTVY